MKCKKTVICAAAAVLAALLSAAFCSCGAITEIIKSALEELSIPGLDGESSQETEEDISYENPLLSSVDETYDPWEYSDGGPEQSSEEESEREEESSIQSQVSKPEETNAIPFSKEPEIPAYTLPNETFPDELEKEASGIIDSAICRAIAVVSVYKDERHSYVSYAFDFDANGFVGGLTSRQKSLYATLIDYAESFTEFEYKQSEYGGDILTDVLTVAKPLTLTRPDIDSYFSFRPGSTLTSILSTYFDPYKDSNCSVADGDVKMSKVKHDAELLQRIIKRVVRKMPEGLTTYDKYLYLASVISAQNTYSSDPDNCYTPFGALVGGKSVCEGYSRAFLLLCREANLWCAYRFGMPKGGGHIWNMIKLDTGIYNVDVTWCDAYEPGTKKWFKYFIKTDSDFVSDGHNANDGVKGTGNFEPDPFQSGK
ncbi:MAG: hypothetical protein J5530_01145 [Clostridia bacterium]|nr:hypothetical protein [Clostridia bacterium]